MARAKAKPDKITSPQPDRTRIIARAVRGPRASDGRWYWRAERHHDRATDDLGVIGWLHAHEVLAKLDTLPSQPRGKSGGDMLYSDSNVGELLRAYEGTVLDADRSLAPGSIKTYRAQLHHMLTDRVREARMDRVSKATWADYRDRQLAMGRASASIYQDLVVAAKATRWAHELGVSAPWCGCTVKVKAKRAKPTPDRVDVSQAIAKLTGWTRLAVWLQYALGARRGEVAALLVEDIDIRRTAAGLVTAAWVTLGRHEWARKTGQRVAPVVDQDLLVLLIAEIGDRPRSERLLPVTFKTAITSINRSLAKAGVPWRTHALRRAVTDNLYDNDVDAKLESDLLGHSPNQAARAYRTAGEARLLAAAKRAQLGTLSDEAEVIAVAFGRKR